MTDTSANPANGLYFLATKLYIPSNQTNLVQRQKLVDRLEMGMSRKLTLLSTPAGFGKTTLMVNWINQSKRQVAWLSLDSADNDATRFMQYLIKAIQNVSESLGENILQMLQSPQPPSFQAAITLLINALSNLDDPLVLVLDDYHLIESTAIHHGIEFLVNHLPPQVHIYITTRRDPPLGISRLRANGELVELRANDLCFSSEEVKTFLNEIMQLSLQDEHLKVLGDRTEGWIVGLKMAAFSMQGCEDVTRRIQMFAGDDRYILDYLLEEVLEQQSEKVRTFLLQTSVLSRFNGELCRAVTKLSESQEILEYLEASNLFIIPLDNRRSWYRFHQLFGDLLKHLLIREHAEIVAELHQRATKWFIEHEQLEDAVEHAFEARDFDTASDLIGEIRLSVSKRGQTETLLKWYRTFPKRFIGMRPLLSFWYAWALIETGKHHEVEGVLRAAERQLPSEMDLDQQRFMHGEFAMLRSCVSLEFEELERTIQLSEYALRHFSEKHGNSKCVATGNLGIIHYYKGELALSAESLEASLELARQDGTFLNEIWSLPWLGMVRLRQGEFIQAQRIFEQAISIITENELQNVPAIELTYYGMARMYWLRNDLETAMQFVSTAIEHGELGKRYCLIASMSLRARILVAQGKVDEATNYFVNVEKLLPNKSYSHRWTEEFQAARVNILLGQGNVDAALHWLKEDERAFEHSRPKTLLLYAELLLHQGRENEALALIENISEKAVTNGWYVVRLNALIVAAAANRSMPTTARKQLTQVLNEDPDANLQLLWVSRKHWLKTLIDDIGEEYQTHPSIIALKKQTAPTQIEKNQKEVPPPVATSSIQLSDREQQVLKLINDGATNGEIADKLCIALSTVKTHINNIYGKFGVRNRTQAIKLARQMRVI